jgi:uncharacterized surface protein with fasciclin (FAS1) repeats
MKGFFASALVLCVCLSSAKGFAQVIAKGHKKPVSVGQAPKDIVQTVALNPKFATFTTALKAAEMTGALSQAGPFTVFAPTNEAFESVANLPDMLKAENKERLANVLKAHVVSGKFAASDLRDGQTLTTLDGEELMVSVMGSKVMINGSEVTQPNLAASNGVIHAINRVIMPGANMGNK